MRLSALSHCARKSAHAWAAVGVHTAFTSTRPALNLLLLVTSGALPSKVLISPIFCSWAEMEPLTPAGPSEVQDEPFVLTSALAAATLICVVVCAIIHFLLLFDCGGDCRLLF